MKNQTFDQWMSLVNQHIEGFFGISKDDLPDCPYYDWYDEGISPQRAAKRAFKNAQD